MSTFDGIVQEFPYIQIDYFRKTPERPPPLACFLSHVHSDHLQGLESFRAPFIYCSAATREMLLRLEKYPHRMNFSKGILESRKLHYKHLSKLLRPIPLNTPTEIELTPLLSIRVTIFDANHCTGAVMFLIEGNGKAILYTGDIRAESWWVNGLTRHPVLLPYTLGNKRIDKLYLDTTFARSSTVYHTFPSKADGLAELLRNVEQFPRDTIFHLRAWTFGYEEVWVALSAALNSKVHVDRYQIGLYRSLGASNGSGSISEAPALCGFELGNRFVAGCLSDDERSRIHSCELGVACSVVRSKKIVEIIPIVNRTSDGSELPEVGAGGGRGDLYQVHELLLPDQSALEELEKLCLKRINDTDILSQTREALMKAFRSKNKTLSLDGYGLQGEDDVPLEKLISVLSGGQFGDKYLSGSAEKLKINRPPNTIHFPYSRHSSYSELCELVSAFKPKDIYPCTVDSETWSEETSMQHLFGHLCSGNDFAHDAYMRETRANEDDEERPAKRFRYNGDSLSQSTSTSTSQHSSCIREGQSFSRSDPTHRSDTKTRTVTEFPPLSSSSRMHPPLPETITPPPLHPENQPLTIKPPSITHSERSRRQEIQRARSFLQMNTTPETVYIGPLPESWSSEVPCSSDTIHQDDDSEENDPLNRDPDPTSQLSIPVSIPESAFASEDYDDLDQEREREPEEGEESSTTPQRRQLQRQSSSRLRREAYLAARTDTYEAWSSVALVSAGNGHTTEEIEL